MHTCTRGPRSVCVAVNRSATAFNFETSPAIVNFEFDNSDWSRLNLKLTYSWSAQLFFFNLWLGQLYIDLYNILEYLCLLEWPIQLDKFIAHKTLFELNIILSPWSAFLQNDIGYPVKNKQLTYFVYFNKYQIRKIIYILYKMIKFLSISKCSRPCTLVSLKPWISDSIDYQSWWQ